MDKVIVKVVGLQKDAAGEENRIEIVSAGKHYHRNGINYILYEDGGGRGTERTSTMLKIDRDKVTLLQRGEVSHEQSFAEAARSDSEYATPYGKMKLSVLTRRLKICYGSVSGSVEIDYDLSINGKWQSENRLCIEVCAERAEAARMN